MDVTVYLPDEIGEAAKAAGLKMSRMLRDAVTDELARRKVMDETLTGPQTYQVALDLDGRPAVGRITGLRLAEDGDHQVFLTEDERVILYDGQTQTYQEIDDYETLREALNVEAYVEAMTALGRKPIIDI